MSDEETRAIDYLASLEPGLLSLELFTQICRLSVMVTAEIAIFKKMSDKKIGVLLELRPSDDLWWPHQPHLPGSVVLPSDTIHGIHDFSDALERSLSGLHNNLISHNLTLAPQYAYSELHRTARGTEHTGLFYTIVEETLADEGFFSIDSLPDFIIDYHSRVIALLYPFAHREFLTR
ncbi:MAG: hypothetical protein WCO19_03260 [Candidatus Saccharibacteria bacterium]